MCEEVARQVEATKIDKAERMLVEAAATEQVVKGRQELGLVQREVQ
jgi:hypothetical protein